MNYANFDFGPVRAKLTEIIGHGLVSGLGAPRPGELCIEAAICLALGEPHGDAPTCVAEIDRVFGVRLNDARWSSSAVRAEALLPLALAQLGTAGTDRKRWMELVVIGTIQKVLPLILRPIGLEEESVQCEEAVTLVQAATAARAARDTARAAYAADAADAADDAADAAKWPAADDVLRAAVNVALHAYAMESAA